MAGLFLNQSPRLSSGHTDEIFSSSFVLVQHSQAGRHCGRVPIIAISKLSDSLTSRAL